MSTLEVQTCGRRMMEWGPWERKEGLDSWETNRWLTDPAEDERQRRAGNV